MTLLKPILVTIPVESLALVVHHDEQTVLCAAGLALEGRRRLQPTRTRRTSDGKECGTSRRRSSTYCGRLRFCTARVCRWRTRSGNWGSARSTDRHTQCVTPIVRPWPFPRTPSRCEGRPGRRSLVLSESEAEDNHSPALCAGAPFSHTFLDIGISRTLKLSKQ